MLQQQVVRLTATADYGEADATPLADHDGMQFVQVIAFHLTLCPRPTRYTSTSKKHIRFGPRGGGT